MASPSSTNRPLPPTPLERATVPDLGTEPIPASRYTSPEWAAREREKMWPRVWLLAGFECDLAEPGSWFTFEIAADSILITRQHDGNIGAFHNVCMHRGNRLVDPGSGRTRSFVCGYHAWRYGSDGALQAAIDEDTFPQGCPRSELDLRRVRVDTWAGFVFINMDDQAESLRDYLGVIPSHLDPYHFEEMTLLDDTTIELDCNWKAGTDAFNEAYHILGTHPDTLDVNDDTDCPIDIYGRHTRMLLPLAKASARHATYGQVNDTIKEHFLKTAGIDVESWTGGPEDVVPSMARSIRETQAPAMGADFSELHDRQLVDDFHYTLFPNVNLNIFGRTAWMFRHRPHPTDPNKEYFDFFNLVRAPKMNLPRSPHQDVPYEVASKEGGWEPAGGGGKLLRQDLYNLPRVQAGMNSRGFSGLHLGNQELRVRAFHKALEDYVGKD